MTTSSVAVIGAGPAGSTAARLLASQGARVVVFETRHLPRDKSCGGGVTPKAQRLVPPDALDTAERVGHKVEFHGGRLPPFRLDEPEAGIAMVQRAAFDLAMAEAAETAGAGIRDGGRVDGLAGDADCVTVTTHQGQERFDHVVVADGDPSAMARQVGLGGSARRHTLALHVDVPLSPSLPDDTAVLSFAVPGGYAWQFPKGDCANVGVLSARTSERYRATGSRLRDALGRFAADASVDLTAGWLTGHWIPQGLRRGPLASRRALLAGDAAATADPLFGEGIAYAIISGVTAAVAVSDVAAGETSDLRPYDSRIRRLLSAPMRRLHLAAAIAGRSPTAALAALHFSTWVRTYSVDVVTGRRLPFGIDAADAPGASSAMQGAYALLRRGS